jgi:hypothetical protein
MCTWCAVSYHCTFAEFAGAAVAVSGAMDARAGHWETVGVDAAVVPANMAVAAENAVGEVMVITRLRDSEVAELVVVLDGVALERGGAIRAAGADVVVGVFNKGAFNVGGLRRSNIALGSFADSVTVLKAFALVVHASGTKAPVTGANTSAHPEGILAEFAGAAVAVSGAMDARAGHAEAAVGVDVAVVPANMVIAAENAVGEVMVITRLRDSEVAELVVAREGVALERGGTSRAASADVIESVFNKVAFNEDRLRGSNPVCRRFADSVTDLRAFARVVHASGTKAPVTGANTSTHPEGVLAEFAGAAVAVSGAMDARAGNAEAAVGVDVAVVPANLAAAAEDAVGEVMRISGLLESEVAELVVVREGVALERSCASGAAVADRGEGVLNLVASNKTRRVCVSRRGGGLKSQNAVLKVSDAFNHINCREGESA